MMVKFSKILVLLVAYMLCCGASRAQPRDFGPAPAGQEQRRDEHRGGGGVDGQVRQERPPIGPGGQVAMQRSSQEQGEGRLMQLLKTLIDLDLSADQKHQIAEIVREQRSQALRASQQDAQVARAELQQAAQADSPDSKVLETAAVKLGQAEKDLAVARARLYQRVRTVLTDEQRTQLDRRREQMRKQMEQRANSVQELVDLWSSREGGA